MLTCKKCGMFQDAIIHLTAEECGRKCLAPKDHHEFDPVENAYVRLLDIDIYGATRLSTEAKIYLGSIPA